MMKRLIVLFDGTWNTVDSRTNVARMADAIADHAPDGRPQYKWYDPGPGTTWGERFRGGLFGYGVSKNIQQGYRWVAERWSDDAELWVFGFSRGAYTARSLVGLIRKAGLLRQPNDNALDAAYTLYRDKDVHPDEARAAAFRAARSREIRVRFIGVWDTVGALGVPLTGAVVPWGRDHYQWHDTELSKIVDYAYHAVAVDEHRADYEATVWTQRKPENRDVEQRWFIGAHANIGGGYKDDPLPTLPLRWLQDKAVACGLGLRQVQALEGTEYRADVTDSYSKFMWGLYKAVKLGKRFDRPFGTGVNETVDDSVWQRWKDLPAYRPPTLAAEAKRRGLPG